MFLSRITMFLLASPAPADANVSLYARPLSMLIYHRLPSAPCRSSQRKHIRHYAIARIHFSLRVTFLLYRLSKQVDCITTYDLSPNLESGVFVTYLQLATMCCPQHKPVSCYADSIVLTTAIKTITTKEFCSRFPAITTP